MANRAPAPAGSRAKFLGPNGEMWSCLAALGLSPVVPVYPPLCMTAEQELGLKDKVDVEDEMGMRAGARRYVRLSLV